MDLNTQLQILENCKQMIEISQNRGCWKAQEMKDIGLTYNSIVQFHKHIQEKINSPKIEEYLKII